MKATDLMIGDWVIRRGVPEEPMRLYDMKVLSGIAYLDQDGRCIAEKFENIEPIPLTSEILEKNGYSYNETRDTWELIPNDGFGIGKDVDDNCFYFCLGIFNAFNRYSDITYHYITDVEYVHELQHALKLCKIEKEIIL